jgi:hypothetical protein
MFKCKTSSAEGISLSLLKRESERYKPFVMKQTSDAVGNSIRQHYCVSDPPPKAVEYRTAV